MSDDIRGPSRAELVDQVGRLRAALASVGGVMPGPVGGDGAGPPAGADGPSEELRASLERFRQLADNIQNLAWMADGQGWIFWYNRRWYEYTGATPQQMEGWGWQSVHDPGELPRILEQWRASLATGQPFDMEFPLKGADGRFRWFLTRVEPFRDPAGRIVNWFGTNTDVHDKREAEQRFRELADAMPQMVWQARPDGFVYYYNERWYEYTGMPRGEGGDPSWEPILHPDDVQKCRDVWYQAVRGGHPYQIEYRFKECRTGDYRWHLGRAIPVKDEAGNARRWFGTCTDIHEQKTAEESARQNEARLRAALESAQLTTWDFDFETGRRTESQAAGPVPGQPAGGLSPTIEAWAATIHPDDRDAAVERYRGAVAGSGEYHAVYRTVGEDGRVRWVEATGRLVRDGDGRPVKLVGVAADVTARKFAEQEREALLESERAARTQAERHSRMKDEFLATLGHELRTPLNAILGWSQLLGRGAQDPEDLAEGLAVIQRNARVQTQLIEDLLDMSRIISGKIRLDVQRVVLPAVIEAALDSVRPAAEARGVRLVRVLDPLAGPVGGDPSRLQQVVWNLLSNAIKFTPRGGRVQLLLERVNSHVEITVSDTGQGIKPEFLPHVFDRFRQADSSTTRRHGGLGLGLAIVKQLVELHGGSVRAKSAGDGQGATFVVDLPLSPFDSPQETDAGRRHPTAAVPSQADCQSLRGVRVLVVDDEPDARDLVRRVLEECEAVVETSGSAAEALVALDRSPPDVLVSDVGMPERDGFDLLREVRRRPADRGGDVPAVALTAFARSEDRRNALMAGFNIHVPKPVEPAELVIVVARLANRTGQGRRW